MELDNVLDHGSDLQHAARCVTIATELDTSAQDLTNQTTKAKQEAATYAQLTTTLLTTLTNEQHNTD